MNRANMTPAAQQARRMESIMSRRSGPTQDEEFADMLRAARRVAGEDDQPLTPEEEQVLKETRALRRRPTRKEITSLAKQLARSSRSDQ